MTRCKKLIMRSFSSYQCERKAYPGLDYCKLHAKKKGVFPGKEIRFILYNDIIIKKEGYVQSSNFLCGTSIYPIENTFISFEEALNSKIQAIELEIIEAKIHVDNLKLRLQSVKDEKENL